MRRLVCLLLVLLLTAGSACAQGACSWRRSMTCRPTSSSTPHHGKTQLSAAFLADVNPAFVLITHGSVNSAESQKQLDKAGIPYTFASWDVIHLSCDGKEWHVAQEVTEVSVEYVRKFWEKKGK